MNRIYERLSWLISPQLQASLAGLFSMIAAYFDSTITFLYALMSGFAFNIFAGMRADNVDLRNLGNFQFPKFVDSLKELSLVVFITYFLKGIIDLMKHDEKSVYAVQILVWLALYRYVRNGLKNLSKAYPKVIWLRTVYHLISFQFAEMMPSNVSKAIEKSENEVENLINRDMNTRVIDKIIVQGTSTKEDDIITAIDVSEQHKTKGLSMIGFHFVVERDGLVVTGRQTSSIGNHYMSENANSIGIGYVGGLNANGEVKDTRTSEQRRAIDKLLEDLKVKNADVKEILFVNTDGELENYK